MMLSEHPKRNVLGWRHVLVAITIVSLGICVTTRFRAFAHSSIHSVKSVERHSIDPKQQRLNKDAVSWLAPVPKISFLNPIVVQRRVIITEPQISERLLTTVLYNRPPPIL